MKNHMLKSEFIIMSTYRPDDTEVQIAQKNSMFRQMLYDFNLPFTTVLGYYQGSPELSFMVFLDNTKGYDADFFSEIAKKQFDQDCIFYRDKYDKCYLGYYRPLDKELSNVYEKIGEKFVRLEKPSDNMTVIDNKFYGVK